MTNKRIDPPNFDSEYESEIKDSREHREQMRALERDVTKAAVAWGRKPKEEQSIPIDS